MSQPLEYAWVVRQTLTLLAEGSGDPPELYGLGGAVVGPKNLARRLWDATEGADEKYMVVLPATVLASALSMLAVNASTLGAGYRTYAEDGQRITDLQGYWEKVCEVHPLLQGRVDPLLGWLDDAGEAEEAALGRCFMVLTQLDMVETIVRGCKGDLLGAVVAELLKRNDPHWPYHHPAVPEFGINAQVDLGAWVPMEECIERTHVYVDALEPGSMWGDVLCKSGTLALSIAIQLRARGRDPSEINWFLGDPNEINLALTAINLAFFGGFTEENTTLATLSDIDKMPRSALGINLPPSRNEPHPEGNRAQRRRRAG